MFEKFLVVLLGFPICAIANPNVLNATTHADTFIGQAISAAVGNSIVDNPIFVDYYAGGLTTNMVVAATNTSASYTSVASGLTVNHAPYAVVNASLCCYQPSFDAQNYAQLVTQGTVFANPIAGANTLPVGTAPPIAYVTASSANSSDGGTGWGIEFQIPTSYTLNGVTLDTSEDSWTSAEIAGFIASLLYVHPSWNFFDAKTALRITAGNWSTGYSSTAFGFGSINWPSANAASTLYLQGPGMLVSNQHTYAMITLLPFRQTRRTREVIVSVNSSYVWPIKNELTTADITASGATILYTSNGTDLTPIYSFVPATSGTVTFAAFTTDGTGNYSRIESYSEQSAALILGTSCLQ